MLKRDLVSKIESTIYLYRYDLFALAIMFIAILVFFDILWQPGQIVFSDIDFPFTAEAYMEEIIGLWNNRWNTTSMLNIPRLFIVLPSYGLSMLFDFRGSMFLKAFVIQLIGMSTFTAYLLMKRLISIYMGRLFDLPKIMGLIIGSLFYGLNPYVIFRIQHIYLLVGYSLFPLVLLLFFKVFDIKFQRQFIKTYSPYGGKIYKENYRDIILLAYTVTMASAAIHYFFYSVLALGIIFILLLLKYYIQYKGRDRKKIITCIFIKLIIFSVFFAGFSFFWLSIYLGSILVSASASQHNINVIDTYTMFSRNSSLREVLLHISYWWRMIPDTTFGMTFTLGGGVLILLAAIGALYNGVKRHIVLLVSLLAGMMALLSTGVQYPIVSRVFLLLCNLPFFGNVFRDPNKLVGLLALCFSILMTFGLESIVEIIRKKEGHRFLIAGIFSVATLSLILYLWPMKIAFVDQYYKPITEPTAYKELRNFYEDRDRYALYLPTAEQMLRPIHHIATPRWNNSKDISVEKATGDVHIYNAPMKTLFHHEGNDPMITYVMNWMQWLLDQGRTVELGRYLRVFGVDDFIYMDQFRDHEARQTFNKEILARQNGLNEQYNNDIFTVHSVTSEKENIPVKKIWTPYGLQKIETFSDLNAYDLLEQPLIFMNQKNYSLDSLFTEGDYIDIKNANDIYLSSIPPVYRAYPFDWVSELNPFLKWSKTYLKNPDWAWYMQQIGNINKEFDLDQGHGVVVTFASAELAIPPHERHKYSGTLVMDFDTMLRTDTFFEAEMPNLYDVQANPIKSLSSVGVVNGVLSKGDPNNIWQVAKSKLIKAKENTPYSYNMLISGRHTNKLHVKVRFFDKDREEIGIQYVTAPDAYTDFEAVNFYGEAVSPKGTKYMRIDLLAFQRPEVKTYWWIHDINIYDYSAHKEENVIHGQVTIPESGDYELYTRVFKSPKGGLLKMRIDNQGYEVPTSDELYGFHWHYIGNKHFEKGDKKIEITNIKGFNAINQLVYLPVDKKESLLLPIKKTMKAATQIIGLEGETDFKVEGNIQSRTLIPEQSNGTGLDLTSGRAVTNFEVIEANHYSIDVDVLFPFAEKGRVDLSIYDSTDSLVYTKRLMRDVSALSYRNEEVHFTPLSEDYLYDLVSMSPKKIYKNKAIKDSIYLEEGTYTLEFLVESNVQNLGPLTSLDKFDPDQLKVSYAFASPNDQNCSSCERISEDMFRHEFVDDRIVIHYDPTCSCDWYIYSTPMIPVTPLEELRVSYSALSEHVRLRHGKLVFVDAYDHVVDTAFVFEVEESEKAKWQAYEQLITVPEGAERVLLQFWARGNKELEGYLTIKDLELERYSHYISLDKVIIKEDERSIEMISNKTDGNIFVHNKKRMSLDLTKSGDKSLLWNSFMSPSNLWRNNGNTYDLALNGITMGYVVTNEETTLEVVLSKVYYAGVLLHLITGLFGLIFLSIIYSRRQS